MATVAARIVLKDARRRGWRKRTEERGFKLGKERERCVGLENESC